VFHHNAMLGSGLRVLDIGGNYDADISGNYYGSPTDCTTAGAARVCVSADASTSTLTGRGSALTSMPTDVGPR